MTLKFPPVAIHPILSLCGFAFSSTLLSYGGWIEPGWSQVIPDRTTPTRVRSCDTNCVDITGGARAGNNLFHSFQDFNVRGRQTVQFSPPPNTEVIFSRVTGANPSRIRGNLDVLGDADLVLINPRGIFFGRNARLNLGTNDRSGGSFTATTADAIRFGEQGVFQAARTRQNLSLLTISPSAFLFNTPNPHPIRSRANSDTNVGLRVARQETIRFLGGPIFIENGRLDTQRGQIELVAIQDSGEVPLIEMGNQTQLHVPEALDLANITLSDGTVLTAESGDVRLEGHNITLQDGSRAGVGAFGERPSGTLTVTASGTVHLQGINSSRQLNAGFFSQSERGSSGDAGQINITTGSLVLEDGAQITTSSTTSTPGGTITIDASNIIQLRGMGTVFNNQGPAARPSGLFSLSRAAGPSGNIDVTTRQLIISNGAVITASAESLAGNAGDIHLDVQQLLLLSQNGRIVTTAGSREIGRNGGNITIDAGLIVADTLGNSDISADAFQRGGQVELTATDGIIGLVPRSRDELESLLGTDESLDPSLLPTNDITTISQDNPNLDGQIIVDAPDVDPAQQVTELPTALVTPQLRQRCYANQSVSTSSFINVGQGGIPPGPTQTSHDLTVWEDLRPPRVPSSQSEEVSSAMNETRSRIDIPAYSPNSLALSDAPPTSLRSALSPSPPLIEAKGWTRNSQGTVTLIAEATVAIAPTPHSSSHLSCP